jgi:hypothetical protein
MIRGEVELGASAWAAQGLKLVRGGVVGRPQRCPREVGIAGRRKRGPIPDHFPRKSKLIGIEGLAAEIDERTVE